MATHLKLDESLSTAPKAVKDDNGNASPLHLGTDKVGIGTAAPTQMLTLGKGNIALPVANGAADGNLYFGGLTDTGQVGMRLFGGKINDDYQSGFVDVRAGNPANGLVFRVDDVKGGTERMRINAAGNVGIDAVFPSQRLTLGSGNVQLPPPVGGAHGNLYFGGVTDQGQVGMRLFGGRIDDTYQSGFIDVRAGNLANGLVFRVDDVQGGIERMRINADGNVGIGTNAPEEALHVAGNIAVNGDIRLLNADCAEDFDICESADAEPGTVMVLGDDGALQPSSEPYDKRVAGVVSGAGQYRPGIVLDKLETGRPRKPIALMGKVYCKVDAGFGEIAAGDLLTTSPTPGHAMKVADPSRALGTVIGKALRAFREGQGLVPVLIALQ